MADITILVDWQNQIITDTSPLLAAKGSKVSLKVFFGNASSGIPRKLLALQDRLYDRCEFYPVTGAESNAVDMVIAFHLGQHLEQYKNKTVVLLTGDRDFSSLVSLASAHKVKIVQFSTWKAACQSLNLIAPNTKGLELVKELQDKKALHPATAKAPKLSKAAPLVAGAKRPKVVLIDSALCAESEIPEEAKKHAHHYLAFEAMPDFLASAEKLTHQYILVSKDFRFNPLLEQLRKENTGFFIRRMTGWAPAKLVL